MKGTSPGLYGKRENAIRDKMILFTQLRIDGLEDQSKEKLKAFLSDTGWRFKLRNIMREIGAARENVAKKCEG